MRLSNIFGAFVGLFLGIMITWATAGIVNTFISTQMAGDSQTLAYVGMAIIYALIVIGTPVMMGIEDETKET